MLLVHEHGIQEALHELILATGNSKVSALGLVELIPYVFGQRANVDFRVELHLLNDRVLHDLSFVLRWACLDFDCVLVEYCPLCLTASVVDLLMDVFNSFLLFLYLKGRFLTPNLRQYSRVNFSGHVSH